MYRAFKGKPKFKDNCDSVNPPLGGQTSFQKTARQAASLRENAFSVPFGEVSSGGGFKPLQPIKL